MGQCFLPKPFWVSHPFLNGLFYIDYPVCGGNDDEGEDDQSLPFPPNHELC